MIYLKYSAATLKSGAVSEAAIHKAVMQWVRTQPEIKDLVLHIPNEGRRTVRYGKLLKDMGMRRGASDLFIAMARHDYHGAWIELKSAQGAVDIAQKQFLADMDQQNYFTSICWSIKDAIETITWYCFS